MVIHLTASTECVRENAEALLKVIATIHELGHVQARDWVEPQLRLLSSGRASDATPSELFDRSVEAVEKADLVVAEGTYASFDVGFQTAIALQRRKPTLLLIRKDTQDSLFAHGTRNSFLTRKIYELETLEKTVSNFLRENNVKAMDLRFNFVLDRRLHNYLRQRSYESGKTKAELVRDLLLADIKSEAD